MELRKLVGHRPLILPGSVVLIFNEQGQLLLQHRYDGSWGLPGGLMEMGESLEETAQREVKEEVGLEIKELELINICSGKEFYLKLAHGDELYSVTAIYATSSASGEIRIDGKESIGAAYFDIEGLPDNLTSGTMRYIEAYLEKRSVT